MGGPGVDPGCLPDRGLYPLMPLNVMPCMK